MNKTDLKAIALGFILVSLMLIGKECKGQNKQEVLALIEAYGIDHPNIVLAQTLLETGRYKCTNCSLDKNNLFGFISRKGGYMSFNRWEESVKEYRHWQKKYYKGGDYYNFLYNIGYATDPEYINKLKLIENEQTANR